MNVKVIEDLHWILSRIGNWLKNQKQSSAKLEVHSMLAKLKASISGLVTGMEGNSWVCTYAEGTGLDDLVLLCNTILTVSAFK